MTIVITPILGNSIVELIHKGGPIMYPILLTAAVALCILAERITWWVRLAGRRDPKRLESVFAAIEEGKMKEAIQLSRNSTDPVIRMIHHGLNHHHSSLQGALEVAAGLEMQKAGRFLNAMDTIVTLGPLLGLLGTVT
ncbi:MAG: MotA/TolQ/ExbB proton channel family protein, partial [Roseimicrobium sp.]